MGTTDVRLPRGVTIRRHRNEETINITFTYKGVKCREPLSHLTPNAKNIKYAERLLGEIYNNIGRDAFNYADYFPKSSKLKIFGVTSNASQIKHYLNEYLAICQTRNLSPSTIRGYKKCRDALRDLHEVRAADLTPALLKNWIKKQSTVLKTIRNQLSFLRSALDEAVIDGVIQVNPVTLIKASRYRSPRPEESHYVVDPLSPDDVAMLLKAAGNQQLENLFRFAINTGLRSSELCALSWTDIDVENRKASVHNASVVGVIKSTKTRAGKRKVDLNDDALTALTSQKMFTFEKGEFVFEDPKTGKPWASADAIRKKAWVPSVKKAGIRYRNPYQTRHTFATRHISQGANLFWLASQMGHKGPEMLFRHYGAYLEEYDGHTDRSAIRPKVPLSKGAA
jgi:integrase